MDGLNQKIQEIEFIDSEYFLNQQLEQNKKILAEGAQGTLLDLDFGTYPFVTSSNTISAGACNGLGIAPNKIKNIIGIFKSYCTRVGNGPFPTELTDEIGSKLATKGNEFGSTTGRARRCGWIDLPALKYAISINGITELSMMKSDVLSGVLKEIKVCVAYDYMDQEITHLPYDLNQSLLKPKYITLKGWDQDISNIMSKKKYQQSLTSLLTF